MKKHIFRNPIKQAIRTQGKRWVATVATLIFLLLALGVASFIEGMPIFGTFATTFALAATGFLFYYFGYRIDW